MENNAIRDIIAETSKTRDKIAIKVVDGVESVGDGVVQYWDGQSFKIGRMGKSYGPYSIDDIKSAKVVEKNTGSTGDPAYDEETGRPDPDFYGWLIQDVFEYKLARWDLQIKANLAEITSIEPKIDLTNLGDVTGCTVVAEYIGALSAEQEERIREELKQSMPEAAGIILIPSEELVVIGQCQRPHGRKTKTVLDAKEE